MDTYSSYVLSQLIESLKLEYIPWRNPLSSEHEILDKSINLSILDKLLLNYFLLKNNFNSNVWFTIKDINNINYRLDYNCPCQYLYKDNNYIKVYNKDQLTTSFILEENKLKTENFNKLDNLINKVSKLIKIKDSTNCYYSRNKNIIFCIPKNNFINDLAYYDTILHEICHWTQNKLNLVSSYKFFDERIIFDEFLAEMTSSFILTKFNLPCLPQIKPYRANIDKYLDYWIKFLERNEKFIYDAIDYSTKIMNYLDGDI